MLLEEDGALSPRAEHAVASAQCAEADDTYVQQPNLRICSVEFSDPSCRAGWTAEAAHAHAHAHGPCRCRDAM